MNTDPKIYGTVIAEWYDDSKYTRLKMHNCTKQEALDRAVLFGYVKPKWFQFWKQSTLNIIAFNADE